MVSDAPEEYCPRYLLASVFGIYRLFSNTQFYDTKIYFLFLCYIVYSLMPTQVFYF